jgi:aminoglycoside phosphotransferase (APT) family kinase protein
LRGGLEAAVSGLTLCQGERLQTNVVLKRLTDTARREAARYRLLCDSGVTPSLLGATEHEDSTYLFLERVRPVTDWPWRDSSKTRLVLEQLARVHRVGRTAAHVDDWDYEDELRASAEATLAIALDASLHLPELALARDLTMLRRVMRSLPVLRRQLMESLGATLIHGDVHTGNVMLRADEAGERVVLLDWGRSRLGSPLEDVSSWLLSLRTWEPAAGRDHDTLFRAYLAAAGLSSELTPELRDAYWIAGASNALAGALRYQLIVARNSAGADRATAVSQARAALRVIRRVDERLRRSERQRARDARTRADESCRQDATPRT